MAYAKGDSKFRMAECRLGNRSRWEGVKVKRVTVTYERTMEMPDDVELVSLGDDRPIALSLDGRLYFPSELVWDEWDASGSPLGTVDDEVIEDALYPAGAVDSIGITIEQVD